MKKFLWFVVVVAVIGAGVAWWGYGIVNAPYRGFSGEEVFVDIPQGTGVSGIARRLADAQVVANPLAFRIAARLSGEERKLQAGEYRFAEAATAGEIVGRLARGDVYAHLVTFREGLTMWEMADVFASSNIGTAAEFLTEARSPSRIRDLDSRASSLEGYLFPDTYRMPRSAGAKGTVDAMVAGFRREFNADLQAAASARGLTVHEAVTLASIVEKETGRAEERPLVSSVYHNRLRIKMPLQCDPTVIYALQLAGRWNGNLTRDDLAMNSPYNTYKHPGLPPGPIASPGRASLEATVRPADASYLYFVSRNDGSHVFASTLAEHNRNVQQWQVRFFKGK
jgi:UPF0755 protein